MLLFIPVLNVSLEIAVFLTRIFAFCLLLVCSACGGREDHKVTYQGPQLQSGFDEAVDSESAVLPLLAIEVGSSGLTAYRVSYADCSAREQTELLLSTEFASKATFDVQDFALFGGSTTVGGGEGQECDYHISILASEGNLPKATVLDQRTEGFQLNYEYASISKSEFLQKLSGLYSKSPLVTVDEAFCDELFGRSCTDLGLAQK